MKYQAAVEEAAALGARVREGAMSRLGSPEETQFRERGMAGPDRVASCLCRSLALRAIVPRNSDISLYGINGINGQ